MNYSFVNAKLDKYMTYYSVYSGLDNEIGDRKCFFVLDNKNIIGGFTLKNNELRYFFIVPPFNDRTLLWNHVLKYSLDNCGKSNINLNSIPEEDKLILTYKFNAKVTNSYRRMLRPTEKISANPPDNFYFAIPDENDKQEIIQAVYEAHSSAGYITPEQPDKNEITEAINRRWDYFTQTDTLHVSTLVKNSKTNEIAGICMAGIYPPVTPNCFSIIHQVSVRPQFRRQKIAESMMLNSIDKASSISQVTMLNVVVGNPAELLYSKIGFIGRPIYYDLEYGI